MKIFTFLCLMLLASGTHAQRSLFVRVYDLSEKKINKGYIFSVTDTSLQLRKKKALASIPVSNIGFIKTRRSWAHNVAVGTLIGGSTFGILGAVSASSDQDSFLDFSAGGGAILGAISGVFTGALIGALTIPFKKVRSYPINGDSSKWNGFKTMIQEKMNR